MLPFEKAMQERLEELVRRFGADTGTLHWIEDGVLVLKGQVGIPPHIVALVQRVPVGKGMAGLAAERNAPVSACNVQTDASGDVRPRAKETGVNGAIVVPVRDASGRVRGALGIGVHRIYEYTPEETDRLVAEAAALAPPSDR